MSEPVLVVGFGINDADYTVTTGIYSKRVWCPYYRTWHNMLKRCYSERFHKARPTYIGCEVCPEWKLFSQFRSWMDTQDRVGKQLDKDFLGDGKLYSPETCCFVPKWLNSLLIDCGRARGKYPTGVYQHHNKFQAQIRINGVRKYLGLFNTPKEANLVYCKTKKQHVYDLMRDYPDQLIKEAVLEKVQCTI